MVKLVGLVMSHVTIFTAFVWYILQALLLCLSVSQLYSVENILTGIDREVIPQSLTDVTST